jgi:excisionase family DNA binding protein
MDENKEIFTTKEASRFLNISAVTLWRERRAGNISFRRAASKILFTREDIEEYLQRNKREALGLGRPRGDKNEI